MTALSVNVNKIAWLRNAREGDLPNVADCCQVLIDAGVNGITVHPRPDQRHIRPDDVYVLATLAKQNDAVEFNIEGNPNSGSEENGYPGFAYLIERAQPDQCTLVPDSVDQLTSDHGWDLTDSECFARVKTHIGHFKSFDTRVSLFLDPVADQIHRAKEVGADRIELFTGPWVERVNEHGLTSDHAENLLSQYQNAVETASSIGLEVNAGHDLNLDNVRRFCEIGTIAEVSIGQALVADALMYGLMDTVRRYLAQLA